MGTYQNTEYKLKYINQSTKSFKQQAQYKQYRNDKQYRNYKQITLN